MREPEIAEIEREFVFISSRSGGAGGQNVNKVNSKVTLTWDIDRSSSITDDQKLIIKKSLVNRTNADGVISVSSEESRSQIQNKETAVRKLKDLLTKAFIIRKPRKPSRPTAQARKKRLQSKKLHSEKKRWRGRLD